MIVATTRLYAGGCHNHPNKPALNSRARRLRASWNPW